MGRPRKNAVPDETEMFPEIDPSKPAEKKMLKAARNYAKQKADRDALLTTCKEKVDGARDALIAAMHENQCDKFRYDGIKAEIFPRGEKVTVTVDEEATGDDEE